LERKFGDARHEDGLSGGDSLWAIRAPGLTVDAHATGRPALVERHAFRSDERLGSDPRTPASGAAHPEARLAELDGQADDDRDDAPPGREDEEGQRDGDD